MKGSLCIAAPKVDVRTKKQARLPKNYPNLQNCDYHLTLAAKGDVVI